MLSLSLAEIVNAATEERESRETISHILIFIGYHLVKSITLTR